ncbi:MAG: adenylate/guanylate cyclase domain-containing protein [Spirochaetes bacterium]|nr:adenylate/guanylate cyclase domain-containing protein [Spirochaetota bacterium]
MRTTKLAAVMFLDVAGFQDLVAGDGKTALGFLTEFRSLVLPIVSEHDGEIFDLTGDEALVVFDSVLSAVQCAIHIQYACRAAFAPARLPVAPRIGLHLGEIWRDETRVYGTGVNIASRVKDESRPGGICVSEDVFHQVSNKLDIDMRLLEGRSLKNIERHLELYEILTGCERGPAPDLPAPATPPAAAPGPERIGSTEAVGGPGRVDPGTRIDRLVAETIRTAFDSVEIAVNADRVTVTRRASATHPRRKHGKGKSAKQKIAARSPLEKKREKTVEAIGRGIRRSLWGLAFLGAAAYGFYGLGAVVLPVAGAGIGFIMFLSGLRLAGTSAIEVKYIDGDSSRSMT